jgi:hypothetical protein
VVRFAVDGDEHAIETTPGHNVAPVIANATRAGTGRRSLPLGGRLLDASGHVGT